MRIQFRPEFSKKSREDTLNRLQMFYRGGKRTHSWPPHALNDFSDEDKVVLRMKPEDRDRALQMMKALDWSIR